jgi:RNA polymerase sigma-70 factor (ECF subfamily)
MNPKYFFLGIWGFFMHLKTNIIFFIFTYMEVKEIYKLIKKNAFSLNLNDDDQQEICMLVVGKYDQFDEHRASLNTFIYNIAKNYKLDQYRKNKIRKDISYSEYNEDVNVLDEECEIMTKQEQEDLLKKIFDGIEDDFEKNILFDYNEGLSFAELAEKYQITIGNIKTRIHRSIKKLKIIYKK